MIAYEFSLCVNNTRRFYSFDTRRFYISKKIFGEKIFAHLCHGGLSWRAASLGLGVVGGLGNVSPALC